MHLHSTPGSSQKSRYPHVTYTHPSTSLYLKRKINYLHWQPKLCAYGVVEKDPSQRAAFLPNIGTQFPHRDSLGFGQCRNDTWHNFFGGGDYLYDIVRIESFPQYLVRFRPFSFSPCSLGTLADQYVLSQPTPQAMSACEGYGLF